MVEIKDISGKTRFSTPINKGAKGKFTLMKEDYIILPFSVQEPVFFKLGDYVDLSGVLDDSLGGLMSKRYEVVDLQAPTFNNSTGGYDYQLRLDAYYWKWKNKIFKYTPEQAGSEASWSLTASLDVQLGVFLRNLKALGYTFNGTAFTFSIDSTVENKAVAMTYDNINLLDALFSMASEEKWNCDCWITDNIIHFGRNEFGDAVRIERGVEAASITSSESQGTYATRIYAFGSTKNIPTNYRMTDEQAVVNGVVQKRLMLPVDTPYIDAYEGMTTEEAIENVVVFEDVYPRRVSTLSDVHARTEEVENEDGTTETVTYYRYKDTGLEFREEYIIEGQELRIQFQSGKLNGMEFGVIFNPEPKDESKGEQLWEIVRNEDYGRPLPDDIIRPESGDEYILSGFDIQLVSDQYIPAAEQELKEKALKYAEIAKKDDGTYPTTLRSSWVKNDLISRTFEFGQRINLVDDTYFENGRVSRVLGWELNLDIPWDSPVYIIGESMPYSRIQEIEDKVDALTYKGQTYTGGGSGVYIIRKNDSTAPSDSNVFSALRSLSMFLRKDQPDITNHLLKLLGGIITDNIQSQNFVAGPLGVGHLIKTDAETGRSYVEVDELYVRLKAYFDTLMIRSIKHVGGAFIASPAGMECTEVILLNPGDVGVQELYDANGVRLYDADDVPLFCEDTEQAAVTEAVYRCYFKSSDGTKTIYNEFDLDDMALCREFNIKEGTTEHASNQYYWRKVVGLGDNYIDLSITDCDPLSGVPQAGDTIVTLGNKTKPERQNAILIYAYGEGSPSFMQYKGINDYSLDGKAKTIISPERNVFTGTFLFETGENIKEYIDLQGETIATEVTNTILEIIPGMITLEVDKQISTVVDDVETIKTEVAALKIQADEISSSVVYIETNVDVAISTANQANSNANNAMTAAGNAQNAADAAQSTANSAYNKANSAQNSAASAEDIANAAKDLADTASTIGIYGQESYNQTNNPWSSWSSNTEHKHVGALWYNPNTGQTKVYVGTDDGNTWETISTSNYATASFILQNSNKISAVVGNFDANGKPTAASGIITEAYGNSLWASVELENGEELISRINQTASTITIDASKINLNGYTVVNGGFEIMTDGSFECWRGKIGGFEIGESSLVCSDGSARLEITVSGYKFFRLNSASDDAFMRLRADDDICLDVTSYGTKTTSVGIKVVCNSVNYGRAIDSIGNVKLIARRDESIVINGLHINYRYVNYSTTLGSEDDFVRFTNSSTITVTMPPPVPGKLLFLFQNGGTVKLDGGGANFRTQGGSTMSSYQLQDKKGRIWICDGGYWNEYFCGN